MDPPEARDEQPGAKDGVGSDKNVSHIREALKNSLTELTRDYVQFTVPLPELERGRVEGMMSLFCYYDVTILLL